MLKNRPVIAGNIVANKMIVPPIKVVRVGISPSSTTPKRMPHTGSRLANKLAV